MAKQFTDVSAKYGAPMGRPSYCDDEAATVKVFRVRFIDGDYDDGGAYWGGGEPLFCARDAEGKVQVFVRAEGIVAARALILEDYPALIIEK